MKIEIDNELMIEGVARALSRWLESEPEVGERILTCMAELRSELMTPAETAAALSIAVATLRENWRDYGLEKSTALGPNEPRYFRSQVMMAMKRHDKLLRGRAPRVVETRRKLAEKITPFPKRTAPTLRSVPAKEVVGT